MLKYAMVGGGPKSFIGPIHRMCVAMDHLAELVDGCYSHTEDWHDLIKRVKGKVDFLAICTPNNSHYAIAKAALKAGLDVMCEKPLSMTAKEAAELERLAAKTGRILGIPFTYTGYPMVKLAKDLVEKGELGKIDKIVLEYQQGSFRKLDFTQPLDRRNAWKMDPKQSGKSCVVADIGVHAFELIEYVTGLEVKSVLADLSSYAPGNRLEDDASILLRLAERSTRAGVSPRLTPPAKGMIATSKIATGEENGVRLRIYGDLASLYWNQEDPNCLSVKYALEPERIYRRNSPRVKALSPRATVASRTPAGHPEGFIEAFANIYAEFCRAVVDRQAHDFPTARDGVRTMKFVEAVLKSNQHGNRWEKI